MHHKLVAVSRVERGSRHAEEATMSNLKPIALLLLVVTAIVLVLQNTQTVSTRLFFVTVSMPLAALLVLTLLIGFAGGVLAALRIGKRRVNA
jgi:uncharacterized integral membrane protein